MTGGETMSDTLRDEAEALADYIRIVYGQSAIYKLDGSQVGVNEIHAALQKARNDAISQWQPISTAPMDGREVLLYRPLAERTNDPIVTIRRTTDYDSHCWEATIPEGADGSNFTEGSCYATHWMPLPQPPNA